MLIETKKIIKFSEEYLNVKDFQDYCHNGLQVEGALEVSKIKLNFFYYTTTLLASNKC